MGEFGRTPKRNSAAGRDHWGHTFSVMMSSGSMNMGQAVGKSSERGEYVAERPLNPEDVDAAVYHHLEIDAQKQIFYSNADRPNRLIERGVPISALIG